VDHAHVTLLVPAVAVLDGTGTERPDWAEPLRVDLLNLAKADGPVGAVPAELPRALGLAGHPLVAARAILGEWLGGSGGGWWWRG